MLKESKELDPVTRTLSVSQAIKPQFICSPSSAPSWNLAEELTLTPGLHQVTKMLFELVQSRSVHMQTHPEAGHY